MKDGFAIIDAVIGPREFQHLAVVCDLLVSQSGYAARNILGHAEIASLAHSQEIRRIVEPLLGVDAHPVRGIVFDKMASTNWKVAWHQDRSIAVAEKREVAGYGPWSVKDSVVHVQPPVRVLEEMVTVRLNIDDCPTSNGPLRVLPGTHAMGLLDDAAIQRLAGEREAVLCTGLSGSVVVMRPLILHASSPASVPSHRRIIHIEYAAAELDEGLQWFEARSRGEYHSERL